MIMRLIRFIKDEGPFFLLLFFFDPSTMLWTFDIDLRNSTKKKITNKPVAQQQKEEEELNPSLKREKDSKVCRVTFESTQTTRQHSPPFRRIEKKKRKFRESFVIDEGLSLSLYLNDCFLLLLYHHRSIQQRRHTHTHTHKRANLQIFCSSFSLLFLLFVIDQNIYQGYGQMPNSNGSRRNLYFLSCVLFGCSKYVDLQTERGERKKRLFVGIYIYRSLFFFSSRWISTSDMYLFLYNGARVGTEEKKKEVNSDG